MKKLNGRKYSKCKNIKISSDKASIKKFEDKLKKITLAYSQLKKTLGRNEF